MLYKFKLSYNATVSNKKHLWKSEGAVNYSTVTRWFKKFGLSYKNRASSGRPKILDFETLLLAIEADLLSSAQNIRSSVSLSPVWFITFMALVKSIWSCWIDPYITKILQSFWLALMYVCVYECFLFFFL